jgi:hypothetical protein
LHRVVPLGVGSVNTLGAFQQHLPNTKPTLYAVRHVYVINLDKDFEGGYSGGQEDLEDRYATTSGEH